MNEVPFIAALLVGRRLFAFFQATVVKSGSLPCLRAPSMRHPSPAHADALSHVSCTPCLVASFPVVGLQWAGIRLNLSSSTAEPPFIVRVRSLVLQYTLSDPDMVLLLAPLPALLLLHPHRREHHLENPSA